MNSFTDKRVENLQKLQQNYESSLTDLINSQKELENAIAKSDTPEDDPSVDAAQNKVKNADKLMKALVNNLNNNIEKTNTKISDFAKLADKNRKQVLLRNSQILSQDKSLEKMNLKLISRDRQNLFSVEKNNYSRVMITILMIVNVILIGYFTYLITRK